MEITCTRCHQAVQPEGCFCPSCGLPQLVYSAEDAANQQAERWSETVRDASTLDWKPAMKAAVTLAVPAGLLSSGASPLSALGLFWMSAAAAWAVMIYVRTQRPAWITIGAGARIGLVTGLFAGWLAFGVSGGSMFIERTVFHRASEFDVLYRTFVQTFQQKAQESIAGMSPADAAQVQGGFSRIQVWFMSPEGHAGVWTFSLIFNCLFLVLFAVGGGALGARFLGRSRRPEI